MSVSECYSQNCTQKTWTQEKGCQRLRSLFSQWVMRYTVGVSHRRRTLYCVGPCGGTMRKPRKYKRSTNFLTTGQARNLLAAFDHAAVIGNPLNQHITVHWSATADMAARVPDRIQQLIECMRHWLRRHGVPVCHVWVQEPSARRHEYRDVAHFHMLVHVPHLWRVAFDAMLPGWVGGIGADNAVSIQGVHAQHWRWRNYLVKGVNPGTRDKELQQIARHKRAINARGPVEGKRCGFSQNTLGPAARARWQRQQVQQQLKAA